MGLRCCASWPSVYIPILHLFLVLLLILCIMVPRYSQGVLDYAERKTDRVQAYYYTTHYHFVRLTPTSDTVYFGRERCHYNGGHNQLYQNINDCPNQVLQFIPLTLFWLITAQNFSMSSKLAISSLFFSVFAAFLHFVLVVVAIVYSCGCCSPHKKPHKALFGTILALHYLAILSSFLAVVLPHVSFHKS